MITSMFLTNKDLLKYRENINKLESTSLKKRFPEIANIEEEVNSTKEQAAKIYNNVPNRVEVIVAEIEALARLYRCTDTWRNAIPGPTGVVVSDDPVYGYDYSNKYSHKLPCIGVTIADLANELISLIGEDITINFIEDYKVALFESFYSSDNTAPIETYLLIDGSIVIESTGDKNDRPNITFKNYIDANGKRLRLQIK